MLPHLVSCKDCFLNEVVNITCEEQFQFLAVHQLCATVCANWECFCKLGLNLCDLHLRVQCVLPLVQGFVSAVDCTRHRLVESIRTVCMHLTLARVQTRSQIGRVPHWHWFALRACVGDLSRLCSGQCACKPVSQFHRDKSKSHLVKELPCTCVISWVFWVMA